MKTLRMETPLLMGILACLASASLWAASSVADQIRAQKILSDLHHANQTEIEIGRMAIEKGASEQVRAYGDQLVKDHEDADKQVQELAQKDGITLVTPPTTGFLDRIAAAREHRVLTDLSKKTGSDFDKAFTDAMIDDHKRDISNLESAANSIKQTDVRELLGRILPTLEQNLDQAQQIQRNG